MPSPFSRTSIAHAPRVRALSRKSASATHIQGFSRMKSMAVAQMQYGLRALSDSFALFSIISLEHCFDFQVPTSGCDYAHCFLKCIEGFRCKAIHRHSESFIGAQDLGKDRDEAGISEVCIALVAKHKHKLSLQRLYFQNC